jgi:DNA ligase (NAD+)
MNPRLIFLGVVIAAGAGAAERMTADPREQISALRQEIARHDELYHQKAAPEIGDGEYDQLKQRLAALEHEAPEAARAVPSLPAVGDDRSGLFQTYRHRVPMTSLEKAYSTAELRAFHARLAKAIGHGDLQYVVEPKFDGLAISVTYEKGKLVRAVSRGNGVEGDDLTTNVLQIADLARELRHPGSSIPDRIELRGEIYVPQAEFERVNAEREAKGEPRFANPRNLAAGTVRQVDARDIISRGVRVVFFGLGACEPGESRPKSQSELHATLEKWGLPTIPKFWSARGLDELLRAIEAIDEARARFPFPTDGAVIKLDSSADQREAGAGESGPRWALAYKFAPPRVETELLAITLQVGRTGLLTPVAELAPVQIAGSKVARATLHNRDEIARRDIRIGDFVYLEKAGDVIPAVVGVNLQRRPAAAKPFQFPIACPECYTGLTRGEGEVAVRCPNLACPAQVRRRVEHFASKACLDIEHLGPAMVDALVGNGWVNDVPDLYRLQRSDLLLLGKHNEKSVDRLLAAIEKSKRAELWRVIHGMGLPQVGASTAKDLARQCGNLAGLAEHGPKAVNVLGEPRYQGLIAELIAVGFAPAAATTPATPAEIRMPAALRGKTFVLTGTLPNHTRAQITAKIESAGGKITSTVSPKTDYVIAGAEPGSKWVQAWELGVAILDEAALLKILESK